MANFKTVIFKEVAGLDGNKIVAEPIEYTNTSLHLKLEHTINTFMANSWDGNRHRYRYPKYIKMPMWIFQQLQTQYSIGQTDFALKYIPDGNIWYIAGLQICPVDYIYSLDDIEVF